MSSKTMAEVVIRSGGRDPPKRVRLLAHFAPGERNLSPESRVRGSQTRRGSSVDRAPRDAARAIRPGKRPEPVVVSVRSGFFLSEAGAFFSSTSVVQLASQVEPPLRDPIGGALGGGAGLGSFSKSNRTFSKSKQRGTALFVIKILPRLIALSCLSLTWTSRQHFKKRRAEPGVREPGNISEIVGAISRVTARQKISPVGAFFFFVKYR